MYGFGDILTRDKYVFPLYPDRQSVGFEDILKRYDQITPQIQMSGPTNFAPVIRHAIEIVKVAKSVRTDLFYAIYSCPLHIVPHSSYHHAWSTQQPRSWTDSC